MPVESESSGGSYPHQSRRSNPPAGPPATPVPCLPASCTIRHVRPYTLHCHCYPRPHTLPTRVTRHSPGARTDDRADALARGWRRHDQRYVVLHETAQDNRRYIGQDNDNRASRRFRLSLKDEQSRPRFLSRFPVYQASVVRPELSFLVFLSCFFFFSLSFPLLQSHVSLLLFFLY